MDGWGAYKSRWCFCVSCRVVFAEAGVVVVGGGGRKEGRCLLWGGFYSSLMCVSEWLGLG